MAMHATTVRFTPDIWGLLEAEADRAGISAAQFVRDAALLRLGAMAGIRDDAACHDAVAAMAHLVRRHNDPRFKEILRDPQRLAAVRSAGMLDAPAGAPFRRLARLACQLLGTPCSAISVLEHDKLTNVERVGFPEDLPRSVDPEHGFCPLMLLDGEPLMISDARFDPRVCDSPSIDAFGAVAYLGVPLLAGDDHMVGALCVIHDQPRSWSMDDVRLLTDLGASVMSEVEHRALVGHQLG